jgi:superfamily II DNA or RNA helicase
MPEYIYSIWEKIRKNQKLGSTCNFYKRVGGYITPCDDFDNNTHEIWLYNIIESKYNCYQIDYIINQFSTKYSLPYTKYNGSGGAEFYVKDNILKLSVFFDKLNINYKLEKININELKKQISKYTPKNVREIEDTDEKNAKSITQEELSILERLLNIKQSFTLKDYQIEMRNIVNNYEKRLNHLIISPTGTGKTVVFSVIMCDFLKKNKDIILLTKKKDVLDQMHERINDYINKFTENNIIAKTNYTIIDCLKSCSTTKLNKKQINPQIYIINWDKLTTSEKTDYKQINWDKFGLIIIDESHWVGAPEICNVMEYIRNKTKVNYIGFSATPIRCNYNNQLNTKKIFGNNEEDSYNILYEYSYYQALTNKNICPIKYCPININLSDLEDGEIMDDKKPCKILSKKAFIKVWKQIKENIINKDTSYFKKGIFWFRSRKEMLEYYNVMKDYIKKYQLIPTMSITDNEKDGISKLIQKSELTKADFNRAIKKFTELNNNAILLSVMRATEGFDDDKLEFGIRMYYSNSIDPLNESQKMGRFNRWHNNKPDGLKKIGYYGSLEISDNKEEIRNSLIQRFKSWIAFARSYDKGTSGKSKETKEKEMKEIIEKYVDIKTLEFYEIDIEKDIIKAMENKEFDKYKIKHALIQENKKRDNKINTKSQYDEWALEMNYPICDELEEKGFSDFKWLFNMKSDDYLKWGELKKVCKEYQKNYQNKKPHELYKIMLTNENNVPFEPEHFYEKQFTNLNDLFYN